MLGRDVRMFCCIRSKDPPPQNITFVRSPHSVSAGRIWGTQNYYFKTLLTVLRHFLVNLHMLLWKLARLVRSFSVSLCCSMVVLARVDSSYRSAMIVQSFLVMFLTRTKNPPLYHVSLYTKTTNMNSHSLVTEVMFIVTDPILRVVKNCSR